MNSTFVMFPHYSGMYLHRALEF